MPNENIKTAAIRVGGDWMALDPEALLKGEVAFLEGPDSDPFAPGEDGYGRERCGLCRAVIYPEEQVRDGASVFCHAYDARAKAEEEALPDSDGVPEAVGTEESGAETVETRTLSDAELLAVLDEMVETREAA